MKISDFVTNVRRSLSDYITRVGRRREPSAPVRGAGPIAELSPLRAGTRLGDLPSLLRALPPLGDDAASFADDLETARGA